jgi:EmrB/QacA subfamily drug resistance transporter
MQQRVAELETARPSRPVVLSGALLAMVLAALDQNIVNTALPRIGSDLGGMGHLSWVVTAFMLTATITTPLYGKLSDLFGRRGLFSVAIITFLIGSLLCGAAHSMLQLVLFRALQGLGAGGLLTLAQAAIADVVSPRERPRYQGLFTGTFALASVAGPLAGGIITQALSWRWVFYVNLPVGIVALALIIAGLRAQRTKRRPRIDYGGSAFLSVMTTALLLLLAWGGTEFAWVSTPSVALTLLVLAALALFIRQEARAPEPLIRLPLFRNAVFSRGVIVGGMMAFAMLGSTVFLPLYFQLVLGMSPSAAGGMMVPQVAGMLLTSIIGGRIVSRIGRNRPFLLAGIGLEALALASLASFAWFGSAPWLFLVSMGGLGLGMGMGMPNLTTAVQNAVAHAEIGAATGAMTFLRSLGAALGVATSGAIMAARLAGRVNVADFSGRGMAALAGLSAAQQAGIASAYRGALTGCFLLSGVVMTAAFVIVWGLPELRLRSAIE